MKREEGPTNKKKLKEILLNIWRGVEVEEMGWERRDKERLPDEEVGKRRRERKT
jgi:hypothetical protein